MKIAIISKSDKSGGGASRVAEDLARLLNSNGHVAHHYYSGSQEVSHEYTRPLYGHFQWLFKIGHVFFRKIGLPGIIPFELLTLYWAVKKEKYDVIHFHDISSAISPLTLMYLAKYNSVVWTLHDCSPFTGGCLYPMDCQKYKTTCMTCPQIGQWPIDALFDFVYLDRKIKKRLHASENILLLSPSKWMQQMAMSSGMLQHVPRILSNGVDLSLFQSIDKTKAKLTLEIPLDRPVILLAAANIDDKRKGIGSALIILDRIRDLNPYVILVGKNDKRIEKKLEGIVYFVAGYLETSSELNLYYAAADIFLNCSYADNQPLIILETMASGTPTVGFSTGGIPEMVIENKTGFLVPTGDINALEEILRESILKKLYILWGKNSRNLVEKMYGATLFLENHIKEYTDLLHAKK